MFHKYTIKSLFLFFVLGFGMGMCPAQAHEGGDADLVNVVRIKVEQGLSHNGVRSIYQDSSGFMWFGTENGLNRYDGYDFKVYKEGDINFPSSGWVTAITEDRQGNLWLGSRALGLKKVDKKTGEVVYYMHKPENPNSLCDNNINVLYRRLLPGAVELWIGTDKGLSRMIIPDAGEAKIIKNYRRDPSRESSLVGNRVTSLALSEYDHQGLKSLWIGTDSGLSQLILNDTQSDAGARETGKGFINFRANPGDSPGLSSNSVTAIYPLVSAADINKTKTFTLWVGTQKGLNRLTWGRKGKLTIKHYNHDPANPNSLADDYVTVIIEDIAGSSRQPVLWIGTMERGLSRFDILAEKFENYNYDPEKQNSLSDYRISSLYFDRSGLFWVGTYMGGVNKFIYGEKRLRFEHYKHEKGDENSLSHNSVRCIAGEPGRDGSILWLGTFEGGLNRLDLKTHRVTRFMHDPQDPGSIGDNCVYCVYFDRSGTLWAGTSRGLVKREADGKFKHYGYGDNPSRPGSLDVGAGVRAIYEDRSGVLWIATEGGGLNKFNKANETFNQYSHDPANPHSLSSNKVYTLYSTIEKGKEILWIGTIDGGLNRFDIAAEKFKSYLHDPSNPDTIGNNFVLCIQSFPYFSKPGQTLWIGTFGGGLNKFDTEEERFTHFTRKDGLADDVIYGILCDNWRNLWLSSNMGISKFNIRQGILRNYYASDGLGGNEFNGGAYYKNKKGDMFFGGVHGLNIFHPDTIYENRHMPPIVLTIYKNFEEIATIDAASNHKNEPIELAYKDKMISFEFAALDFLDSTLNRYAYKLEPLDSDWINCGTRRTVSYPHLEPGTHVFRVKGSNNDNTWNEQGVSVKLKVFPSVWQSWWFRALAVLGIYIFFFFLYRARLTTKQKKTLELQVAEKTREFKEASERAREMALQAQSANESKSRFLANISHEIRTPLTGIIGLTDLLAESSLSRQQRSHLSLVKQSANHLLGILNDILDFSKIEAGQLNLNRIEFDFFPIMEEVRNIALQQVKSKGLAFQWFIRDHIPAHLIGDPKRLKQILINLIDNAVKFTDEGTIGVEANGESENNDKNNITIHFSVSDTGIGIPPDRHDHIFESFTQGDDSISRRYGGTGLGLAISRQLVAMMGGKIWFESEPNRGSKFHFTARFPVSLQQTGVEPGEPARISIEDMEISETAPLISRLSTLKNDIRLLLVEDNAVIQKVARYLIKKTGIPVDIVGDGLMALEAVKQRKYALILMDLQMPDMDGFRATEKIREEMGLKDIPIIAMTAHAMKEDREKCFAVGMNDYVTKPFKPNELYHVLYKWLQPAGPNSV
jgi:two-component system sensor histidine kinase ChiS